jgi:hypothetical protein
VRRLAPKARLYWVYSNQIQTPHELFIYWLLLQGGITESIPCNCNHFLMYCAPHLSSNHFQFIYQSSVLWLQQRHLIANWGETGWEMATEFCLSVSIMQLFSYHRLSVHNITFFYVLEEQILSCEKELADWFDMAVAIPRSAHLSLFQATGWITTTVASLPTSFTATKYKRYES